MKEGPDNGDHDAVGGDDQDQRQKQRENPHKLAARPPVSASLCVGGEAFAAAALPAGGAAFLSDFSSQNGQRLYVTNSIRRSFHISGIHSRLLSQVSPNYFFFLSYRFSPFRQQILTENAEKLQFYVYRKNDGGRAPKRRAASGLRGGCAKRKMPPE
jgi:hypothetical protein